MLNTNVNTGFIKFTFTDEDGDIFASFKLNPTDPRLHFRVKEIGKFFSEFSDGKVPQTTQEMLDVENAVESKFCELLGYDCRATMFSRVAATDIMGDGRMFLMHVMETLVQNVAPEIRKRRRANIEKYTSKYNSEDKE